MKAQFLSNLKNVILKLFYFFKGPLDDCIGIFLSNCDQHAIPLLFRALPPATQEIFKTLYDTYNKFYKFTGKI